MSSARDGLEGSQFGGYSLHEVLGRGGMGTVYRARQDSLRREVALKILEPAPDGDLVDARRFRREAGILFQLDHPSIVKLYDAGTIDGRCYLAMELVEGKPLDRTMEGRPLSLEQVADFSVQLAEALHFLHEKGILHRDLKPGNILVTGERTLKVLDFGLARHETHTLLTAEGGLVGTLAYLAPEVLGGQDPGPASDVYALGLVLHEMLLGRRVFQGPDPRAMVIKITSGLIRAPAEDGRPDCPGDLDQLVRETTARDPAGRPAMSEVARRSRRILESMGRRSGRRSRSSRPDGDRAGRSRGRGWLATKVLVSALAVVAVVAAIVRTGSPGATPSVASPGAPAAGTPEPSRALEVVLPMIERIRKDTQQFCPWPGKKFRPRGDQPPVPDAHARVQALRNIQDLDIIVDKVLPAGRELAQLSREELRILMSTSALRIHAAIDFQGSPLYGLLTGTFPEVSGPGRPPRGPVMGLDPGRIALYYPRFFEAYEEALRRWASPRRGEIAPGLMLTDLETIFSNFRYFLLSADASVVRLARQARQRFDASASSEELPSRLRDLLRGMREVEVSRTREQNDSYVAVLERLARELAEEAALDGASRQLVERDLEELRTHFANYF